MRELRRQFLLASPTVVLLIAVVVVAWAARAMGSERLVTPDERFWIEWSTDFATSLGADMSGSEAHRVYPGVTILWLTTAGYLTIGPDAASDVRAQLDADRSSLVFDESDRGIDWIGLLSRLRAFTILANVALLALAFLQTKRLLGLEVAALGTMLIALDPFTVGLTRLLGVDGLTGMLMLVSMLGILCYAYRGQRWIDLGVSAGVGGLAVLTRFTSIVLVVFVLVLVVLEWRRDRRDGAPWSGVRGAATTVVAWTGGILATCVALWPELRLDPVGTLSAATEAVLGKAGAAHEWQTFFAGQIYQENGNPLFYPAVFVWRAAPATLIGLLLAAAILLVPRTKAALTSVEIRTVLALAAFAISYGVLLTISPKKFDRYLIPAFAPLIIVAAWGWVGSMRAAASVAWPARRGRWGAPASIVAVLAMQVWSLAPSYPYYLSYYSPLLGGPARAAETMMIGWGEGFDQVAAFLNGLPDAAETTVLAGPWSTPFAYFYDGTSLTAAYVSERGGSGANGTVRGGDPLLQWSMADYRVVYVSEEQRGMIPEPLLEYFSTRTPVMSVTIQGLEYARLYDIRDKPLPEAYLSADTVATDWGGMLRLVAYELPAHSVEPGASLPLTVYVQALDPAALGSDRLRLRAQIVDRAGVPVAAAHTKVLEDRQDRVVWPVRVAVPMPRDVEPGRYRLEIAVQRRSSGPPLPWSIPGGEEAVDAPFRAGTVVVRNGADRDERGEANAAALD